MPTKLRHAAIAWLIAAAALVALVAQGCTVEAEGHQYREIWLQQGDTYDASWGICKWTDDNPPLPVWGRPYAESPSPYGIGWSPDDKILRGLWIGDRVPTSDPAIWLEVAEIQTTPADPPAGWVVLLRWY